MQLTIHVHPSSSKNAIVEKPDGSLAIYTTKSPHDDEANRAVLKMLAKHLKVPKTSLKIIRGTKSKHKLIEY